MGVLFAPMKASIPVPPQGAKANIGSFIPNLTANINSFR